MKYSKDGPFMEPVVRCDSCSRLILVEKLKKIGMCPDCSNMRVRNVRTLNEEDYKIAKGWADSGAIDPDWLLEFQQVEE